MRRVFLQQALALAALSGASGAARAATAEPLWFIFLERGKPTPPDREAVMAMQRGHIENFKRLFALGRLFSAGPLADPSGNKRGIVTVRAESFDELMGYFQPDAYVREGYMTVNAVPALARRAHHTEGIDASQVEELRIVLIARTAAASDAAAQQARLQALLDSGRFGAWYSLQQGPLAEVLFARSTDTAALQAALSPWPGGDEAVQVWRQWLSPGVVR